MNKITFTLPPIAEVSDDYMMEYLDIFDKHAVVDDEGFSIIPTSPEFRKEIEALNAKHNLNKPDEQ